jgi:hypothetical protein
MPYAPGAIPACAAVYPLAVIYSTRKTLTKLPKRFRKTPANRIQSERGKCILLTFIIFTVYFSACPLSLSFRSV